ncbi:alpha/beta hydrolase-fold protein [Saccharopolyspora sp. WRP15-2]|uniref:Alpha/beta hydrolase-fold protein n=1 Tax=Saccharopolyspora oryzae TaxID=2997343 RepID=A0ABT4V9U1_9PSEU|nr:alpha/beta hydrolase-fold protein [Saccharopolyspora oryzae]
MAFTGVIGPGPQLPASVTEQAGGRSPLESVVLVAALAVLTVLAIVVVKRRRMRKIAIAVPVLLALLTVAAGVNSYVGYVRSLDDFGRLLLLASGGNSDSEPSTPIPPTVPGGVRVADVSLPDPGLGIPTGRTRVLLPPGYDDPAHARDRYPVVYLVHGYPSGGPDDWLGPGGAIQTLQALSDTRTTPPMIIVAVDATAGTGTDWECLNVPGGPQLETYLTSTVPREVDARFRTLPDRGDRAIGGMSGGAFCALNLGLRNQGTYSAVLASEPYDDPGTDLLAGHPDLQRANSPHEYLPTLQVPQPFAVMLHAGVVAHSDVDLSYRLADQLAARGVDVAVRAEPGEWHTWRTARIGLPYLLTFAAQHFTGDQPPKQR